MLWLYIWCWSAAKLDWSSVSRIPLVGRLVSNRADAILLEMVALESKLLCTDLVEVGVRIGTGLGPTNLSTGTGGTAPGPAIDFLDSTLIDWLVPKCSNVLVVGSGWDLHSPSHLRWNCN